MELHPQIIELLTEEQRKLYSQYLAIKSKRKIETEVGLKKDGTLVFYNVHNNMYKTITADGKRGEAKNGNPFIGERHNFVTYDTTPVSKLKNPTTVKFKHKNLPNHGYTYKVKGKDMFYWCGKRNAWVRLSRTAKNPDRNFRDVVANLHNYKVTDVTWDEPGGEVEIMVPGTPQRFWKT